MDFTLIVPYYRNPEMLKRQGAEWLKYPPNIQIIVVDDGSPEPAADIVGMAQSLGVNVRLFRIMKDIPWNRGGARNLGAMQAKTDWIIHVDVDHILPETTARALEKFTPQPNNWFRFSRYRVGKADFTRKKDDIPDDLEFGKIKPHMDSYMCERALYMRLGGYDEDYSGGLGGGTPFVKELQQAAPMVDLPEPYVLHVHTTDSVPDASDIHLSRDTTRFKRLQKEKSRTKTKKAMCQFDWREISFGG